MLVSKMLIKRNLLIYFRDKSAVFFSVLSSIITLCLYVLFLNNSLITAMESKVADIETLKIFLNSLVLCGVISLNAFTIPLSFMYMFIYDKEVGTLKDFFVSPVKKSVILFAYIVCAMIATLIINILITTILVVYLYINNMLTITLSQSVVLLLFYLLCSSLFSLIAFVLANFIKRASAYGNLIGVSSALVGFLSGVYMPIGNFGSKTIENVITLFPITQLNAVLRASFLNGVTNKLFLNAPIEIKEFYNYFFGIKLKLFENDITIISSTVYLLIIFVIAIFLAMRVKRSY